MAAPLIFELFVWHLNMAGGWFCIYDHGDSRMFRSMAPFPVTYCRPKHKYPVYRIPRIGSKHLREAAREEVCLSGSLLSTAADFMEEAPEQVFTGVIERTGDHATYLKNTISLLLRQNNILSSHATRHIRLCQ